MLRRIMPTVRQVSGCRSGRILCTAMGQSAEDLEYAARDAQRRIPRDPAGAGWSEGARQVRVG